MTKIKRDVYPENVFLKNTSNDYIDGLSPKWIKILTSDMREFLPVEQKKEIESLWINVIEQSEKEIDSDIVDVAKIENVLVQNWIEFIKDWNVELYIRMYLVNYIEDEDIYLSDEQIVEKRIAEIELERKEKLSFYQNNDLIDAMAMAVYTLVDKKNEKCKPFIDWVEWVMKINTDSDTLIEELRKSLYS